MDRQTTLMQVAWIAAEHQHSLHRRPRGGGGPYHLSEFGNMLWGRRMRRHLREGEVRWRLPAGAAAWQAVIGAARTLRALRTAVTPTASIAEPEGRLQRIRLARTARLAVTLAAR